jgi:ppGpp synthetase/RelA/SpoT-type nucleotidyltranferase
MSENAAVTKQAPDEPANQKKIVVEAQLRLVLRDVWPALKVSTEFLQALDYKVKLLVSDAAARCAANHRRTLKPQDL